MITNYSLTCSPEIIKEKFHLDALDDFSPNFNIQPTQKSPAIASNNPDQMVNFNWGIIGDFTRNKTVSNKLLYAPLEDIPSKASLRSSLNNKRCVILADSFYSWKSISKKGMIPYRSALPNNEPFAMAGLWTEFTTEDDQIFPTFKIITTEATGMLSGIADRVPVVLNEDLLIEWLNPATQDDSLLGFLNNAEVEKFKSYPVTPRLKDPNFNSQDLWKEVPPADQFGNLTLFN